MTNILFITYFIIPLFACYEAAKYNISTVKVADSKNIPECITGLSKTLSKYDQNTPEKIMEEGYPVEEHVTLTEDGYLLTLFRIPGRKGARAVLINHGFLGSSFDWVVIGKKRGLPFLLADKKYDVWLGNLRGSTYSRCHAIYKKFDKRFWDFSFSDMGKYDLPAQIDYITSIKKDDIVYIGHSLGTTASYILAIEKPNSASKLKAIFSLAPVAFQNHVKIGFRILAPFSPILVKIVNFTNHGEILSNTASSIMLKRFFYRLFFFGKKMFTFLTFSKPAFDESQLDYNRMFAILNHYPAGGSVKTVDHLAQLVLSKKFRDYDYGSTNNLKIYNSTEPKNFNLTRIQVPVGLFWANNDELVSPKDVKHLADLLPKKIINYKIPDPKFSHGDFLWGKSAPQLLYSKLISEIENYI